MILEAHNQENHINHINPGSDKPFQGANLRFYPQNT